MRAQVVRLRDDEEAIDHPAVRLRLAEGEDDEHLVHIGGDDALAVPTPRLPSGEHRGTRGNGRDAPAALPLIPIDRHVITDGELEGAALLLLEPAGERRIVGLAGDVAHAPDASRPLDDDRRAFAHARPSSSVSRAVAARSASARAPMRASRRACTSATSIAPRAARAAARSSPHARKSLSR